MSRRRTASAGPPGPAVSPAGGHPDGMRLDKWLWVARFFRTRESAAEACVGGGIRLNGQPVTKAHAQARPGDTVVVARAGRVDVVRILALAERRGPAAQAALLYESIAPSAPPAPP